MRITAALTTEAAAAKLQSWLDANETQRWVETDLLCSSPELVASPVPGCRLCGAMVVPEGVGQHVAWHRREAAR